ncbi:MAG: DUF2267 domain-containing protein [Halolamina sp.]
MDYSEFLGEVQHRIDEDDLGTAVKNTRAVLTTIGERIQADEAKDLAGPLPMEIDRFLTEAESGQRFDFTEFIERVAERADVEMAEANIRAQAITALVADVVPPGEVSDLEDDLPADYADLFEFVGAPDEETPW